MNISIGDVFSRLTVIEKAEDKTSPGGRVRKYWLCKCSCDRNKTLEVRSDSLTGERVRSCGCLRDETARKMRTGQPPKTVRPLPSLAGNVYGLLTVVKQAEPTETPKGRKMPRWECSCECGETAILYHERLRNKEYVSCGCVSKKSYDAGFKSATEGFISKAKEVHGDKYDYSLTCFESSRKHVTILCKTHGEFKQISANHLTGNGCPRCGVESRADTLETFIVKSEILHSNVYDYSKVDFISPTEPVTITCKVHGDFEQRPKTHLGGLGCPLCSRESVLSNREEEFIRRSIEKHGDRYDYSEVVYEDVRIHVKVGCPSHGTFLQRPDIHMLGSKCPKCSSEERAAKQHWDYLERCKLDPKLANSPAVLYLLKLNDNFECFLKVGISSSFKRRLSHYKEEGLDFEVLEVVNTTAIQAALLERETLKYIRESSIRYIPNKIFAGWTECATLESKDQLLEIFKELSNNV